MNDFRGVVSIRDSESQSEAPRREGCILCGSALEVSLTDVFDNRLGTSGVYEIWRCTRCGQEQTLPKPSFARLKDLYESHYNFGGVQNTLYTRLRERFLLSFLNRLWTWLDGDVAFHRRRGTGRLLDIGCNEGRGLRIFARNGFETEGLELSETAAAVARQAGFEVHTCLLEEFGPLNGYDVAVLSNVLEHSLDPRQMLLNVHRILAKGGRVWISCPNAKSWLRELFGRSWVNWHVPFHISHFSPKALRHLLDETGYSQIEMYQITPALWVAHSIIILLFAEKGKKTNELRNPFLTLLLMLVVRFVGFPALWLGNRLGRGDCLLAIATKQN